LDRVGEFQIEIPGFRSHVDANTIYVVDGISRVVAAEIKDVFPYAPMGMDTEKAFTKGNENRDMKDGVGSQLV
jgi:hypothetical protein